MNQNSTTQTAPISPVPIPRTGLRGSSRVFLFVLLFLAAAAVGIGISAMRTTSQTEVTIAEVVSGASLFLLTLYLWRVCHRAKAAVFILAGASIFLAYLCNSLIPSGVLTALIFEVTLGSLLLSIATKKQRILFWFIPAAAYVTTALISRDPVGAVAAFVPFPAALTLSVGTRNSAEKQDGLTRVGVICATSLALGLSIGGMIVLSLYRYFGSLDSHILAEALNTVRATLAQWITTHLIPDNAQGLLRPDYAENLSVLLVNLLPGYAVLAINVLSFMTQILLHATLVTFGCGASITERVRVFRMSLMSCLVFTVAYIMAISSGTETTTTLAGTIAENIYLILLPGLAFAGLLRFMTSITRRGARGMGCMTFLVFLLPLLFLTAPFILAAYEVIAHIMSRFISFIKPPADNDPFGGSSSGKE